MSTFPDYRNWFVVEATDGFGAGTIAAKLLADLGCTVARLAPGPDAAPLDHESDRALFELLGRCKESVAIDWHSAQAAAPLTALLQHADVLVVDRSAWLRVQDVLGTRDFASRFPRLTVCACTPFGLTGPLASWTGGEEIVQAMAGIMSITGHADRGPTRVAGAPLTHASAMFAVSSVLADALRKRAGTPGALLDVAVYDAALAFQSASLPAYFLSGTPPQGIGNRHSMAAPWNSFRCADGWAIICAGNHPTWVRLCETIGRPDLLADPRYATQGERVAHVDALEVEVAAWTSTRSVAEVESALNAGTIACGSVVPLGAVVAHPQFVERNLLDAASGQCQSGGVFHLGGEPLSIREGAWRPGAATRTVLVDRCGVRTAEFERWVADGAVHEAQERADVEAA
jgi:crotonobetainyl-CoA:carnitine CoA-transferase CaiB-like acyl-CoA transferase